MEDLLYVTTLDELYEAIGEEAVDSILNEALEAAVNDYTIESDGSGMYKIPVYEDYNGEEAIASWAVSIMKDIMPTSDNLFALVVDGLIDRAISEGWYDDYEVSAEEEIANKFNKIVSNKFSNIIDNCEIDVLEFRELIMDYVYVDFPFEGVLQSITFRVNLLLGTHDEWNSELSTIPTMVENYKDDEEDFDISEYDTIFKDLCRSQGTDLIDVLDNANSGGTFIDSLRSELDELYSYTVGLVVLAGLNLKQISAINSGSSFTVNPGAVVGLFAPEPGSGSNLDIDLESSFNVSGSDVIDIEIEGDRGSNSVINYGGYTVDDVYGLVGSAWNEDAIVVG